MYRSVSLVVALFTIAATPVQAEKQMTNLGVLSEVVFDDPVIADDGPMGPRILYAPSDPDDPQYRALIGETAGGTVDYFDARAAVPDLGFLLTYSCIITWTNYEYADNAAFGDVLADYVDAGGSVILGVFCAYTTGNHLAGRIMEPGYSPVTGGFNQFSYDEYRGGGYSCIYTGVPFLGSSYRDRLTLQGDGFEDGLYRDFEIAHAYRPDLRVIYSNGSGSTKIGGSGNWARTRANGCRCGGGSTPIEETSWGRLKSVY